MASCEDLDDIGRSWEDFRKSDALLSRLVGILAGPVASRGVLEVLGRSWGGLGDHAGASKGVLKVSSRCLVRNLMPKWS